MFQHTSYPLLSSVIPVVTGLRTALGSLTEYHATLHNILLRRLNESFADVFDDDELCAATVIGLLI